MIKAVSFFKRKAGMPVEEFQAYWLGTHPTAVVRLPGVRRYVQSHTLLAGYRKGEPIYDGIAELWFDDRPSMARALASPQMAALHADGALFIGANKTFVVEEKVIIG